MRSLLGSLVIALVAACSCQPSSNGGGDSGVTVCDSTNNFCEDAGTTPDGGRATDAGQTPDAGRGADSGPTPDGGFPPCLWDQTNWDACMWQ